MLCLSRLVVVVDVEVFNELKSRLLMYRVLSLGDILVA